LAQQNPELAQQYSQWRKRLVKLDSDRSKMRVDQSDNELDDLMAAGELLAQKIEAAKVKTEERARYDTKLSGWIDKGETALAKDEAEVRPEVKKTPAKKAAARSGDDDSIEIDGSEASLTNPEDIELQSAAEQEKTGGGGAGGNKGGEGGGGGGIDREKTLAEQFLEKEEQLRETKVTLEFIKNELLDPKREWRPGEKEASAQKYRELEKQITTLVREIHELKTVGLTKKEVEIKELKKELYAAERVSNLEEYRQVQVKIRKIESEMEEFRRVAGLTPAVPIRKEMVRVAVAAKPKGLWGKIKAGIKYVWNRLIGKKEEPVDTTWVARLESNIRAQRSGSGEVKPAEKPFKDLLDDIYALPKEERVRFLKLYNQIDERKSRDPRGSKSAEEVFRRQLVKVQEKHQIEEQKEAS
jgi:hypothetical protein